MSDQSTPMGGGSSAFDAASTDLDSLATTGDFAGSGMTADQGMTGPAEMPGPEAGSGDRPLPTTPEASDATDITGDEVPDPTGQAAGERLDQQVETDADRAQREQETSRQSDRDDFGMAQGTGGGENLTARSGAADDSDDAGLAEADAAARKDRASGDSSTGQDDEAETGWGGNLGGDAEQAQREQEFAQEHDPADHDVAAGEEFRQRGDWTAEDAGGPMIQDADGNITVPGQEDTGQNDAGQQGTGQNGQDAQPQQ